ncbi:aromatic ring-opening dioxygenase LigA [Streptomyces sp. NPDC048404]|uniref:aromatic ring-opening dioxygenase LigA n=1 Tax=unclassified Streptomyces TaxID=2593676 RepID=UPI00342FA74B
MKRPRRPPGPVLRLAVPERPKPACEYGNPRCDARPARPYPSGWMCDEHQPANTTHRTAPEQE